MEKEFLPRTNLITLNRSDNEPLSLDESLFYLLDSLNLSWSLYGREFIQSLCEIAIVLHRDINKNGINANKLLYEKYFLPNLTLPPIITSDGVQNLLFTNQGLRLLSLLISCECSPNFILPSQVISGQDYRSLQYRIIETFFFANQLLIHLQQDINDISYYYLNNNSFKTPLNIILRSRILYDTSYFNKKLKQYFSMSSHELNNFLYLTYSHVYINSPARIEPDTNFHQFFSEDIIIQIKKIINSLAKELKNESISYSVLRKNLRDYYTLDKLENPLNRGKPFFKIDNRFVCMRPDQLADAFDTFPYFRILKELDKKEADEFFYQFGKIALERYIDIISKRVFGDNSIKPSKKKESDPCADRIIIISPIVHVLIELKSARAEDQVKGGSKKDLENKFITIFKSSNKKQKGILQLFKATKKYREDDSFNGTIYTIIVYYGDFPEISTFDELIESKINSRTDCQEYLKDTRNKPSIWLNLSHLEVIFNIVKEGGSFEELLQRLSKTPPSKTAQIIINYARENSLDCSILSIFERELEDLETGCTSLYK